MKTLLFAIVLLSLNVSLNAQIYTPTGTIQGTSNNNNVGIGTSSPDEKLVLSGNSARLKIQTSSMPATYYTYLESNYNAANTFNIVDNGIAKFGAKFLGMTSSDTYMSSYYGLAFMTKAFSATSDQIRMYVTQTGNVGIGTTDPDEKLTVKGKIHTQEVRVDMLGPRVPDYVFANDYKLKSLPEVENYIKQNNHLPEIPSAKEIESNGLMLAEMNLSLLKKIEELTLYAIEQQKENEKMKRYIEMQDARIDKLEEIIKKLE